MKKWIILPIIVFIIAISVSTQMVDYLNRSSTCMNCHGVGHGESDFFLSHSDRSISCIDCHSGNSTRDYVNARKELINAILYEKSAPLLRFVFQNESYNINITHLKSNCKKCHPLVSSKYPDHTNLTYCSECHNMSVAFDFSEKGLLKKIGTGSHRDKTCEDCHSTNFRIPECTICHISHNEKAKWSNSICLDCHNDPHVPILNGSLNTGIAKENCGVCHESPYEILTYYNSRHNELSSCANCHPVHKAKKTCFDCHRGDHLSHPYASGNCNSCHGKATCKDCHKEPHAPLSGLPRISTQEMFNDYALTKRH